MRSWDGMLREMLNVMVTPLLTLFLLAFNCSSNNPVYPTTYALGHGHEVMFTNLNLGNNRACFSSKNQSILNQKKLVRTGNYQESW